MTGTVRDELHRAPPQDGPPLWPLAALSTGLLVAGVIASAALGGLFPSPYQPAVVIREHFLTESPAVRAGGVLTFASAVPLALYAATAHARLRRLGVVAPGATIALVGGVLAAAALALSGLLMWTLSRPAVRGDEPVVRALQDLAFLSGGPAHVVFLGLLVAGIAVPGLLLGLLPRPVALCGLAVAVLAELGFLALVWQALSPVLPAARFPALLWLIAAGVLLPRQRVRRGSGTTRSADPAAQVSSPAG